MFRPPDMQLSHVFIAFFMREQAFPHVFIAFLAPPSFLLGAQWALLGSPFRDGGGAVELLGQPLGPKWCQKHHDEGLKSDLGSSRSGQGVSEALDGSILRRNSSLIVCYFVFWYVSVRRGWVRILLQRYRLCLC